MARSRTLAQLRTDVRERVDMPGSEFVSDANLNTYINQSIAELYGMLVNAFGQDYYEKSISFTTTNGQSIYTFAGMALTDFWRLLAVEMQDGSYKRTLRPFMRKEHARWSEYPVQGGYPITLYYVPSPPLLSADGDNFDGIAGWEEWVVLDVAIKILNKEESDVSVLMSQQDKVARRIKLLAPDRDAGWPDRLVDTSPRYSYLLSTGAIPQYRLRGATGLDGSGQAIELLWGPNAWF